MARNKTGTITGANLDKASKGRKGGLTGSKRVTGEDTTVLPETPSTSETTIPIVLPTSDPEVAEVDAQSRANLVDKLKRTGDVVGDVVNAAKTAIQKGTSDPSSLTDGKLDAASILANASADVDSSVAELDSAEAIKRNITIAKQRNYVGVAINNTKLKQDLATLNLEQQRLIGLIIDGKTAQINNETKAVTYQRAVVGRDTEFSRLDQDRELLTQQEIRTAGTQSQTEHIQEQENLKIDKLKEQNEKTKYEIQNISYEKEKVKKEAEAKFLAGF